MKASLKILIATSMLLVAGAASADGWRGNPYLPDAPRYQNADRYERPDYRYNDWRVLRYVERMQAEQRERIEQGVRDGSLTPREAQRLMAEQRDIERQQRMYMADGRLDPFERQHLMNELEQASRDIWREKHDAQERVEFRPPWWR